MRQLFFILTVAITSTVLLGMPVVHGQTIVPGEVYFFPDSLKTKKVTDTEKFKKFRHRDYISVNLFRPLVGELVIHFEHINNKGRGIETGFGFTYPMGFWSYNLSNDGTWDLYGVSFWLAEKFYYAKKPLLYVAPEFAFHAEYNDDLQVYKSPVMTHCTQMRLIPSLTIKAGWRDKSGVVDLYIGVGGALRYTQTKYHETNPPFYYHTIPNDNGFLPYVVIRAGMKLGFPIKTDKKTEDDTYK